MSGWLLLWLIFVPALTLLALATEGPGNALAVLGASTLLGLVLVRRHLRRIRAGYDVLLEERRKSAQAMGSTLAATQQEANTLQAALDGMTEGVWVTDETGTLVHHNPAVAQLLPGSLPPGTPLVGQRPMFLLRHHALHEAVMGACREGKSSQLEISVEGSPPRTFLLRVNPLKPPLKGSTAVFHDVTEVKRLERIRQDFVANVSHELRTPITAILGYAETLLNGALTHPSALKMVDVIHRQSQRLSDLVADLLDLSRLDAGELGLNPSRVAVAPVARRVVEALALKASDKRLSVDLAVPEVLFALADEKALEQVLTNLLDNAVKYTPEGGRVLLQGTQAGSQVQLSVRDNGPGIEPRHLPRLFERFYRVDRGRSRDQGGTGLGLSIVKHLMVAMRGDVRVASQMGEGCTFTVLLPVTGTPESGPNG